VQIGRISRFGLMEMSRQRLKPSLGESTQVVCPRCTGQGTIRTVESLSLSLVRILEEEALKSGTSRVDIQVPIDVATYMLNEKRQAIAEIEKLSGVHVLIVANPTLETPHYKVERVRKSDRDDDSGKASYQRADKESQYNVDITQEKPIQPEQAAVQSIKPGRRPVAKAPEPEPEVKAGSTGLLGKIVSLFSGDGKAEEVEEKSAVAKPKRGRTQQGRKQGSSQNRNRNRSNRNRNRNRKQDNKQDDKQDSSANKQAESQDSKQSQATGSQGKKPGGQSSRNRRRGSNRSRSNASNKNESKSNAAPQKNADTAAAPDKKAEPASPAKAEAKPQTTTEKGGSSGQKKAASTPTPNKAVTDKKPNVDKEQAAKKPAAAKSKPSEKSVDKQPSSNENRPATSVIHD
jgi:ribonuclease E